MMKRALSAIVVILCVSGCGASKPHAAASPTPDGASPSSNGSRGLSLDGTSDLSSNSTAPSSAPPTAPGLTHFVPRSKAFALDLPCNPKEEPPSHSKSDPPARMQQSITCIGDGSAVAAWFADLDVVPSSDAALAAAGENFVDMFKQAAPDSTALKRRPITVDGVTGAEVSWTTGEKSHLARILYKGKRVISVVALSVQDDPKRARAVLDSVRLLSP